MVFSFSMQYNINTNVLLSVTILLHHSLLPIN